MGQRILPISAGVLIVLGSGLGFAAPDLLPADAAGSALPKGPAAPSLAPGEPEPQAPPAPASPASRASAALLAQDCLGPIREVPGQGPSCPVQGGWRVFFDGGSTLTHGPDPYMPDPPGLDATARNPMCIASPTTEYHAYAIYAVPSDKTNRYATQLATIRARVADANGILREEAGEFSKHIDFKFRCTSGLVTVANETLPTTSGSDSYSTITSDLSAKGYNSAFAKYWVFYDDGVAGACGQGGINGDDSLSVNNANNVGPDWAISYGTGCWTGSIALHEAGHNLGAVQLTAPYTSGGWHCNDGLDIMCYADGGSNSTYSSTVCTDRSHFDCRHDSYFHPSPTGSNWLVNHWNLAHSFNRFIHIQADCGLTGDAAGTHAAASLVTLPKTNCAGALADGDSEDWYKFSAPKDWIIKATMTPNSQADFDICLYRPTSTTASVCSTLGTGSTDTISFTSTENGDWRLRVYVYSSSGTYTLSLSLGQNDCLTNVDAGATHAAATLITLPKTNCAGALPSGDTDDYYQFSVTNGQVIRLTMTPNAAADFDLCLYPPGSTTSVRCSVLGTGQTDTFTYTATSTGNWRGRVYVYSGLGTYTFSACVNC